MQITEVMIDDASGGAIIPGRINIRDFQPKLGEVVPHDLLLLDFGSSGLVCRPVLDFERLQTGFCRINTTGPYIRLRRLNFEGFNSVLFGRDAGAISISDSGNNGSAGAAPHDLEYDLTGYDLSQKKVANGLSFRIVGNLKENALVSAVPAAYDDGFVVEGIIPWDALIVKGFRAAGGAHKFTPQGKFLIALGRETVRDSHNLRELTLSEGGNTYVFGSLQVATAHGKRAERPAENFLDFRIESDRISFNSVSRLEQLTNGFCRDMYRGKDYYLSLNLVGRRLIEEVFQTENYAEFGCEGLLLGKLSYNTGYGNGHGDPLDRIEQSIGSYRLIATLGDRGLRLQYEGRLREFEAQTFERHRKERNSSLVPWQTFSVDSVIPWSLLVVRDFAIARRRKHFVGSQ